MRFCYRPPNESARFAKRCQKSLVLSQFALSIAKVLGSGPSVKHLVLLTVQMVDRTVRKSIAYCVIRAVRPLRCPCRLHQCGAQRRVKIATFHWSLAVEADHSKLSTQRPELVPTEFGAGALLVSDTPLPRLISQGSTFTETLRVLRKRKWI